MQATHDLTASKVQFRAKIEKEAARKEKLKQEDNIHMAVRDINKRVTEKFENLDGIIKGQLNKERRKSMVQLRQMQTQMEKKVNKLQGSFVTQQSQFRNGVDMINEESDDSLSSNKSHRLSSNDGEENKRQESLEIKSRESLEIKENQKPKLEEEDTTEVHLNQPQTTKHSSAKQSSGQRRKEAKKSSSKAMKMLKPGTEESVTESELMSI